MNALAARAWPDHVRRESPGDSRIMLLLRMERWDVRRDGRLNESALRQKLEARGYKVSARVYPPGTVAAAQTDGEGIQALVSGLLRVTIDGESAILTAGDLLFVPRGAVRRLEVLGPSPALCLDGLARR